MSDNLILELIEQYLNGDMMPEERVQFELLRKKDASVDSKVVEHKLFIGLMKQYGERIELEKRLNAIHDEIDVHTLKEELMIHPNWIVSMWRHHHSKISVAASIAIFAILSTLFFTGKLNNHDSSLVQLRDEVSRIKTKTDNLDKKTNSFINQAHVKPKITNPGSFRGTGFALSSNGYIATNYHVINNADSIYVQNANGESFHAKVVYTEPQYDLAILQINDASFKDLGNVPYNFKRSFSDLGEGVYTFGYPGGEEVYGPGSLTASTGYSGDTTEYQVSIPVNPGNSGGPLIDDKGNIIGVISAKQTQVAGAAFAKKSAYLLKTIQNIPSDSLSKSLTLSTKNTLAGLSRPQQLKKLKNYVFMVKVY
ncbi:Trypsin-like peptidase domain-containing protein [Mucilaginibacter pineti]|uniref:Trypsin-like peptidase domain-containing protein n=1 Tax=Mucilaginibacter pineti TaxID=1391627 RepID=A0A1G6XU55_9SPHI|nr:serine protease [Mucilaginibacter pineti]SDD80945.1 Trypsin-like peptidase domain-containing protein [Mucilaginibacter pineti]